MSAQGLKLAGVLATTLVIIQTVSVVLLWQLVVDDDGGGGPAASQRQPAPLPPLPESRQGGSARALLDELDATTRRLEEPLREVRDALTDTTSQIAFLPSLPPLLAQIGANTSGFGALPGQLDALVAQTRGLAGIRGVLAQVVAEVRRLAGLTRSVGDLTRGVGRLEGGLGAIRTSVEGVGTTAAGIGRSFDRAVGVLERMADDVARMRACIEEPGLCRAEDPKLVP